MSIGTQGEQLIFLVSQPRSGSTLLQRILNQHPAVHTTSEPWLMLHPFYALRNEGYTAAYGSEWAHQALTAFLDTLPTGEVAYYQGVRQMYRYLYNEALAQTGARFFLDKTPRYYLILPELQHTFPEARIIILVRNPLAVLASMLSSWVGKGWFRLWQYEDDLLVAPKLLADALSVGEEVICIRYEDLVTNPEKIVERLCVRLGLTFDATMIEYGRSEEPAWQLGDRKILQHTHPVDTSINAWKEAAAGDAQVWRLMHEYLECLGPQTIEALGYDYAALCKVLETMRPATSALWLTFSLDWLMRQRETERSLWAHRLVRFTHSLRRRGLGVTLRASIRSTLGTHDA